MKQNAQKVILVDDHALLRAALSDVINSDDAFCVIGTAGNGRECLDLLEAGYKPHLIILDLNMPIMDGFETAEHITKHHPHIQLLVLTMYNSEIPLIRLLQMGIRGFVSKDIDPVEFKLAMTTVLNHGYYYSNDATGKLGHLFQKIHDDNSSYDKNLLTDREIEFLKCVGSEDTYREIAKKMNVSSRAVDHLRDGLFDKLNIKSRVGLVIFSMQNGILMM